ncbi:MAG: phage portal protein [Methylococcales bacterium]|nr:phage portal protein [Methylococcales bacterium]
MRPTQYKKRLSTIVDKRGNPMEISNAAYDASSTGRRLNSFDAPGYGPNLAATVELNLLRNRSRASIRNNPWMSRGLKADVANEIGTGIVPRSKCSNEKFKKEIRLLWSDWTPYADAGGILDAYGVQMSAVRARKESGEVFIRIRQRLLKDNLPVPVQFQLIEADFCPVHLNSMASNGNEIISGIEFDSIGRRVAYWMYKKHPGEYGNFSDLVRVPASEIIHHYIPLRPGQIRGEPNAIQAIVRAHLYEKYDDAELGRKETRAHYTGVIHRPDYGQTDYKYDPISGLPISEDDGGVPQLDLEPGTFSSLLPGEQIELFDGDPGNIGYLDYQRQQLLSIAAGMDVPYELVSGDYRGINDRVWRAIMNQYRREVEQTQDLFTIQQVCLIMWETVVDIAIRSGAISAPGYETKRRDYLSADHRAPAWAYINPLQDANAMAKLKNEGFESRSSLIAERGWDAEDVDQQRADDAAREKKLGLI